MKHRCANRILFCVATLYELTLYFLMHHLNIIKIIPWRLIVLVIKYIIKHTCCLLHIIYLFILLALHLYLILSSLLFILGILLFNE